MTNTQEQRAFEEGQIAAERAAYDGKPRCNPYLAGPCFDAWQAGYGQAPPAPRFGGGSIWANGNGGGGGVDSKARRSGRPGKGLPGKYQAKWDKPRR